MNSTKLALFEVEINETRQKLLVHPIFKEIQTLSEMQNFMEAHVFAVWDFMTLLKALQIKLTSTTLPWTPPINREAARFINEIVICEESDEISPGEFISHFELYLEAMHECGANPRLINRFLENLSFNPNMYYIKEALMRSEVPSYIQKFVLTTMDFCTQKPHLMAAAFLYGREDIIPEMFTRILSESEISHHAKCQKLKLYLERHIEVDGDSHGPMGKKLMLALCGDNQKKWEEAAIVAKAALTARIHLWDELFLSIKAAQKIV